jgi:hypothetical protein
MHVGSWRHVLRFVCTVHASGMRATGQGEWYKSNRTAVKGRYRCSRQSCRLRRKCKVFMLNRQHSQRRSRGMARRLIVEGGTGAAALQWPGAARVTHRYLASLATDASDKLTGQSIVQRCTQTKTFFMMNFSSLLGWGRTTTCTATSSRRGLWHACAPRCKGCLASLPLCTFAAY